MSEVSRDITGILLSGLDPGRESLPRAGAGTCS